jgi:hypothetical protein
VKAPDALSRRVLASVRARRSLPWWQQSIWHWPNAARTAFLVALAVVVAVITGSSWWAGDVAARGADVFNESTQALQPFSSVALTLWRTILQNVIVFAVAFSAMLYLLCLGAGTMFFRFAVRRS